MRKIFLVGHFNPIIQSINELLVRKFQVQLCADNSDVFNGMIKMADPDLVIISLMGLNAEHKTMFKTLSSPTYSNIPVICIGKDFEREPFEEWLSGKQYTCLPRPIYNEELLKVVNDKLCLDPDEVPFDEYDDNPFARLNYFESQEFEKVNDEQIKKMNEMSKAIWEEKNREEKKPEENVRKRILVVDDDPIQLRSLRVMLKKQYDVDLATTGAEAMNIMTKNKPGLIFLDYEMPVCDGKRVLKMIRSTESYKDIPVVFLTGVNDTEHIRSVMELKPDGYLLKPADQKKILECALRILGV